MPARLADSSASCHPPARRRAPVAIAAWLARPRVPVGDLRRVSRAGRPRSARIAICHLRLRRAFISSTPRAGCICGRSSTDSTPSLRAGRGVRARIGAASIRSASSFEAPRTGWPDSSTRTCICLEPTARPGSFCSAATITGATCSRACFTADRSRCSPGCWALGLSLGVGMVLGGLAGFYGGWVDETIMRAAELFLALPWLYLLFAVRMALPLQHRAGAGVSAGPRGDRARRVGASGAIDPRPGAQRQAARLRGGGAQPWRLGPLPPAAARVARRCSGSS